MNKKYAVAICVLSMFLFLQGNVFSQLGSISGKVYKQETGKPLNGVVVRAKEQFGEWRDAGMDKTAGGASKGIYKIEEINPGVYSIYAKRSGYGTVLETNIQVNSGEETGNHDLYMTGNPGWIFGTVNVGSSGPLEDVWVTAYIEGDEQGMFWIETNSQTDLLGGYNLPDLSPGSGYVAQVDGITHDEIDYAGAKKSGVVIQNGQGKRVNFALQKAARIYGSVKNSEGNPIKDVGINCWVEDNNANGGWDRTTDDQTGNYRDYSLRYLLPGYTYNIEVVPPQGTDYIAQRFTEYIDSAGDYPRDIVLESGAITISGNVTDAVGQTPLLGIQITYWNDDLEIWREAYTSDEDGKEGDYSLTNLPAGEARITARPASTYAWQTEERDFQSNDTVDFALAPAPEGRLSGVVRDYNTGKPISGSLRVDYSNEEKNLYKQTQTVNGAFSFTGLPEGIADIAARPEVSTGYAWQVRYVYIAEDEDKAGVNFFLRQGARISGSLKDKDTNDVEIPGIEVQAMGSEGEEWWGETNKRGNFKARLAPGSVRDYIIGVEDMMEGDWVGIPQEISVVDSDDDQPVELVVYGPNDAYYINGEVRNSSGPIPETLTFVVAAFKEDKDLDKEAIKYAFSVTVTELGEAGFYELRVPPGNNYDLYLVVMDGMEQDVTSTTIRSSLVSVVPTENRSGEIPDRNPLDYDSQGGTVTGTVTCGGQPVLMATVFLEDNGGELVGFADTDENGVYHLYNVPELGAGDYFVSAWRPYCGTSDEVQTPVVADEGEVEADMSILAAPSKLTTFIISSSKIKLTWKYNSNGEDGFRIERKVNNGNFILLKTRGPNVTSYINKRLRSNKTYTYRVRAYEGEGNSAYSNEAGTRTSSGPYIKSLRPSKGKRNKTITIKGKKFGSKNSKSKVIFYKGSRSRKAKIRKWKNSMIKCKVPRHPKGKYRIKVINSKGQSNTKRFTIK